MRVLINRKFIQTGPMIFVKRLFDYLTTHYDVELSSHNPDIYFCVINFDKRQVPSGSKAVLRIDGMYWDLAHTNIRGNRAIFASIKNADGVIFQSQFCKRCYESSLCNIGTKNTVILNAVDWSFIRSVNPVLLPHQPGLVASAEWRPTKRASSICKGFLASDIPHHLYMIGKPDESFLNSRGYDSKNSRITWLGMQSVEETIGIMKSCSHAIHLGKFDPCPNSVIEEICCGLPVLHTSNGGAPEIVLKNGIRMPVDLNWDYKPIHGVDEIPPKITADYLKRLVLMDKVIPHKELDIKFAAKQYYKFFMDVLS